ncbi:MAG: N-acetylglucosamine kinase [Propioniciclava sp.]
MPDSGVVAIDIGGSGSRARWKPMDGTDPVTAFGPAVQITRDGASLASNVALIVDDLVRAMTDFDPAAVRAVCVGATGIVGLAGDRDEVYRAVHTVFPAAAVLLAADGLCATMGALGGQPGAVVAVGTGTSALGTDSQQIWHTVDGWGHVFGDAGSGAWIGRTAMTLAAEQFDGRRQDAAPLLDALVARLGEVPTWPSLIYTNNQRAGVLASLAPTVVGLAVHGDQSAAQICRDAGAGLARTLAAALVEGVPPRASWAGALLSECHVIRETFLAEFARLRPWVGIAEPAGTVLDGAGILAQAMVGGDIPAVAHTRLATWYPAKRPVTP